MQQRPLDRHFARRRDRPAEAAQDQRDKSVFARRQRSLCSIAVIRYDLIMPVGASVKRRHFLGALAVAAVLPLPVRAQQTKPVIGFFSSGHPESFAHLIPAFRQGLGEFGFSEGHDVTFEYQWAAGDYRRFPALASEFAARRVAVIVANGGTLAALAAKQVTSAIPIVFFMGGDPVEHGLVASLNQPGGNATGIGNLSIVVGAKRLALMRELLPKATEVTMLVNPAGLDTGVDLRNIRTAARAHGLELKVSEVHAADQLPAAFAAIARSDASALFVATDPFFNNQRQQIVSLAAQYAIPATYDRRDFPDAGGLLSYGYHRADSYRQLGIYTGRILKGERPANLPVVQPTKFEFVINIKTAKSLGLTVPLALQVAADEIIE